MNSDVPENNRYTDTARGYQELIMEQLRRNDETTNRLEGKLEAGLTEVRSSIQALMTAHITHSGLVGERVGKIEVRLEQQDRQRTELSDLPERVRGLEAKLQGVHENKNDGRFWISTTIAIVAALIAGASVIHTIH